MYLVNYTFQIKIIIAMCRIRIELQVFKMHPFILKRDVFLNPYKLIPNVFKLKAWV
jgi:hypothetical protein